MAVFEQYAESLFDHIDFKSRSSVHVFADENTFKHCYPLIRARLPKHSTFTCRPGERAKNINTCVKIWKSMTDAGLDRSSLVINLGGGVICDMGGFCAATFKRGIAFVHCPTTLLAQVDASIGGKLGIDFQHWKNQIGLFHFPKHVLITPAFLKTLPNNELLSGHAEMIKHSLISGGETWEKQKSLNVNVVPSLDEIRHSIEIKESIVAQDAEETGNRKILNFGHTIGHALEGSFLANDSTWISHGQAVAVGMIAELFLSHRFAGLSKRDMEAASDYLMGNFPIVDLKSINGETFAGALAQDKKNRGGLIRASLLQDIGKCMVDVPLTPDACWESLMFYRDITRC